MSEDNSFKDAYLLKIARKIAMTPDKDVEWVLKVQRATAQCGGCGGLARLVLIDGISDWWCDGEQSQCAPIFLSDNQDTINGHPPTPLTKAVKEIVTEYKKAVAKFPEFNSCHEGYAVIEEELDELWAEVKKKTSQPPTNQPYSPSDYQDKKKLREEAIQVAAMSLRFLIDCCDS